MINLAPGCFIFYTRKRATSERISGCCRHKRHAQWRNNSGDSVDSALFRAVLTVPEHVLHPLLPPRKKTGYNLRKRSHVLMPPEAKSSFSRNNFLVRMLYTDVYWHLYVFTLLFYVPSLRLSMTFNKETDDEADDVLIRWGTSAVSTRSLRRVTVMTACRLNACAYRLNHPNTSFKTPFGRVLWIFAQIHIISELLPVYSLV